ncbi:MAG: hypothetical protein R3B54_09905 [Bdellovibrionota bacterium]
MKRIRLQWITLSLTTLALTVLLSACGDSETIPHIETLRRTQTVIYDAQKKELHARVELREAASRWHAIPESGTLTFEGLSMPLAKKQEGDDEKAPLL